MVGAPGSLRGIQAPVDSTANIAIRNGILRSWNVAIDLSVSDYNHLSGLRIVANSGGGIRSRLATTITNCIVSSTFAPGIVVQDNAVITGCTLQSNGGIGLSTGLDVDSFPSVITHNTARANVTNNYKVVGENFLGTIINTTAGMNAAPNNYGNLSF